MIKWFQWIHSATCNFRWHYGIRGGSNIFSLSIFIGIWVFLRRFCFRFFFFFSFALTVEPWWRLQFWLNYHFPSLASCSPHLTSSELVTQVYCTYRNTHEEKGDRKKSWWHSKRKITWRKILEFYHKKFESRWAHSWYQMKKREKIKLDGTNLQ